MNDPKSKLDALEAVLGVDETEEVERPEVRRSVGEILEGASAPPAAAPPAAEPVPAAPTRQAETGDEAGRTPPASAPRRRQTGGSRNADPKVRTSALLPGTFTQRFDAARERRWGFPELVESAVGRPMPSEIEAEERLAEYDGEQRSLRSFSLAQSLMNDLDRFASDWRMNRSQVLTVLLAREFDQLGF